MMSFSYDEVVKNVKYPGKLELVVDSMNSGVDVHLSIIGRELKDWRGAAPFLNIRESQVEDIIAKYPNSLIHRGPELLISWKKQTLQPTYSKLVQACVDTRDASAANKIVQLLNDMEAPLKITPVLPEPDGPSEEPIEPEEKPSFSLKDNNTRKPSDSPSEGSTEYRILSVFSNQVEIILQTVHEPEYIAALSQMDPPPGSEFRKAVCFKGRIVGLFAGRRAALIKTDSGMDVRDGVTAALEQFQNAKYILSVGICYSFEEKLKKGDVVVSKKITRGKIQFKQNNGIDNRGDTIKVVDDLKKIFCKNVSFDYHVSKTNRKCEVYVGHYLSFPALVDSADYREKLRKAVSGAIAGEKEGKTLSKIQEERTNKIEGVILIKGVVECEDEGRSNKEDWHFTSSLAALCYAKEKLMACKNEMNPYLEEYEPLNVVTDEPNLDQDAAAALIPTMHTNATEDLEGPVFDAAKQEKEYKKKMPAPPPRKGSEDKKTLMLFEFTKQIHIILLTVDQCEYQAVVTEMRPPNNFFDRPVKFPTLGIVIGTLGLNPVALIKVGVGMAAADCLKDAVEKLPNAKFVVAVGGCYGFDQDVLQRGDILVSNAIISQNQIFKVEDTLLHLFTDELAFRNDYCVSNAGRLSRVYKGKYDLCYANEKKSEFGEAIGGEFLIEGGVDPYLLHQKEILGVIVVKGVIGHDENTKMNTWQFTATKAATSFAKHKLNSYNSKLVATKYPNPSGPELNDFDTQCLVENGLGYGVDATELNSRKGRHFCIRELITEPEKNFERKVDMTKTTDDWHAFDKTFFDTIVKAEITENPDPVRVFGGESFSTGGTHYKSASGYRVITRSIQFNPDLTETENNAFINEMCKALHLKYPRIPASTPADFEKYFANKMEKIDEFVGDVYKFIEEKKVTHYISALDYGAAEYIKSTSRKNRGRALQIQRADTFKGKMAAVFQTNRGTYNIGNIDSVEIGSGEGVVEYKILPVYSLLHHRHEHFRNVVSKAVKFYLDRKSGPYWIKCGSDGSYLQVENERLQKVKDVKYASKFRIVETDDLKYFSIQYQRSEDSAQCYVNSSSSRNQEVRVNCRGSRAFFCLHHTIKPKNTLSIAMWKSTFCSIQLKQMNFKRSFLGWRVADGLLAMKKEGRSEFFKLMEVPMNASRDAIDSKERPVHRGGARVHFQDAGKSTTKFSIQAEVHH